MVAREPEARLAEAVGLAEAIGVRVVRAECHRLDQVRPATFLGRGVVERLAEEIAAQNIALVIMDARISPVQQRNLEQALAVKVIDRTALILEIFGDRARTHEGRLQVELAALTWQRSRLVRTWTHLERQRGGFGFLGGPGESQLEIDRRLIDERIERIKRDLAGVVRTRSLHRRARQRGQVAVVALVGYTNAGKSTLFNALTKAHVDAKDMLFATLDPTMRRLDLPSGRTIVLSDTVGFISRLPTELIAAFRATLEEVRSADLLLHVRDIAHSESAAQKADVLQVLEDLVGGAGDGADGSQMPPVIEVANKMDLLPEGVSAGDGAIPVSAVSGRGLDRLLAVIDEALAGDRRVLDIRLANDDGATLAWLYRRGRILSRHDEGAQGMRLRVSLAQSDAARLQSTHKESIL
ncbi:MAG: GTPase HflX [Alphaproteobacteria bacterium]